MANRSTRSRDIPRGISKLVALSKTPADFKKRGFHTILVKNKDGQLVEEARPVIEPDYDKSLRSLFKHAHGLHRAFKNRRLSRDLATKDVTEESAPTATV